MINVSCNGANDGSATATITLGGSTPYTYSWSQGAQTSSTATGLLPGFHTVIITDSNGCITTKTVSITEPTIFTATATAANILCSGGTATATVTAAGGTTAYTYLWSQGNQTTQTATGLLAGSHTVVLNDANNCTIIKTVTIAQPIPLTATATATNILCNGGTTTATVTAGGGIPGYIYLWASGSQSTQIATGLVAGNQSVTVIDTNGCTQQYTVTILQPSLLVAPTTSTPSTCGNSDGAAAVSPVGGTPAYTYSWSTTAVQTTTTATGLSQGSYTVLISDANGCSRAVPVLVANSGGPTPLISSQNNVSCNGESTGYAMVNPNGGTAPHTYTWSNGQTTSMSTGLSANTYTVIVIDANNCSSSKTVIITQAADLIATATHTSAICGNSDGTASVTAIGGAGTLTYGWNNGQTTSTAVGLMAITYTVIVSDDNNCTNQVVVTISDSACPCPKTLHLPNAFSPNNDGENDDFCTLGGLEECIKELQISIYNRWGERVYESTDPRFCWDGIYKGNLENTAVFVYYLHATLISGDKISRKGNVSLIR